MIRSILIRKDGSSQMGLSPAQMQASKDSQGSILWVDFEGETPQVSEPILHEVFGFHPLAIDDALQESHVPKIDDWDTYLYIVLHDLSYRVGDSDLLQTLETDIFLGKTYIVTHHDTPVSALDRVWASIQGNERHTRFGPDHILYRITDELVVDLMEAVEKLDEEIDQVETIIFSRPNSRVLNHTFRLKRAVLRLRRILSPQREVLNKLARDEYEVIDAKDRVYFRDVYDHLVRMHDITESLRDLIGGVLDTYLSVVNNRMNDIMKTLTIITTLFMPISFVASFFGMNFFAPAIPLEKWTSWPAFVITLIVMLAVPVTMFAWMNSRGWMVRDNPRVE